uniref:PDZ domain-containing protein n=1 Tax=Meloidogyne incognita TaxID=6306 RepID=A0A914L447_MELIC
MALTSFCRDKWINGKYKIINVELNRDSKIGLGITVAGYVYKKEEISGVFIKSLVPQSSAHLSKQIQLHDLIVEVNGRSLEGLSHNDSVRALINSGNNVVMKLVRFDAETPQAKCLKMLHEQELAVAASVHSESAASSSTATGRVGRTASPLPEELCQHHKKHSLVDYKSFWSNKFGSEYDIIVVDLKPDDKIEIDGGIGIEWQGTVDVCNGNQLCSHHFISSLRRNGPAEKTGILKAGDELLQVNDISLYGESFVKMRKVLNRERRENSPFIRLIFCRKTELDFINFVIPSPEQCLPIAYPLLASMMAGEEHFIKAKSEIGLCNLNGKLNGKFTSTPRRSSTFIRRPQFKSRSLENLSGLAVWNCVPLVVPLLKDDPLHPEKVVLIIRSLVPGGAAQADGRIVPGDRLLFVNDKDLSNSSLENAVEVLKTAPVGQIVRLGIAKPVPIEKVGEFIFIFNKN